MGYEMRFYVVNKHDFKGYKDNEGNEYKYGNIIAMYDYSKDYDLADFIDKNGKPTDCYIFANDRENETIKDSYGEHLKEITVDKLLDYLEQNPCYSYRRYAPFMYLLRAFKEIQDDEENNPKFEDLVVLRYGY